MICPFCSENMDSGFLSCARKAVVWNPEPKISEYPLEETGGFLVPMERLKYDGTYYTKAYFCKTCSTLITPIKKKAPNLNQNPFTRAIKKVHAIITESQDPL